MSNGARIGFVLGGIVAIAAGMLTILWAFGDMPGPWKFGFCLVGCGIGGLCIGLTNGEN